MLILLFVVSCDILRHKYILDSNRKLQMQSKNHRSCLNKFHQSTEALLCGGPKKAVLVYT